MLAGDHMKAASDMALPFVGVGLLYRHGYFRQTIDADGHQEHRYPDYDLGRLPLTRALGPRGRPADGAGRAARARRARSPSGWSRSVACRCCCSTRTTPSTIPPTGRSPTSCTCAVARCGSTRSSSWASAACGRCARWASSRRRGTSTRATRRSCSWSGRASCVAAGVDARRGARRRVAEQRVHDPHAGLRGQRALRRGPRPARSPARSSTATAGRNTAACPSSASWRSAGARTATRPSST